jgi:hypothetical protein
MNKTMNKKLIAVSAVAIILVFVGYMVIDSVRNESSDETIAVSEDYSALVRWKNTGVLEITEGKLKAVTVSVEGMIYVGGESFISCYGKDLKKFWSISTPSAVTSLSANGDIIYATTTDLVLVLDKSGKISEEWGPFEDKSIFTSISAGTSEIAVADAGNKMLLILDNKGVVKKIIGQNDGQFVVPSPYFDVALDSAGLLYVANTGNRRLETRKTDGTIFMYFGEPGTAPENFCGCCNPAHFIKTKDGYITAEKGINRIKILGNSGEFMEFVSVNNNFEPSVPLDLAYDETGIIYAANPSDSKLYLFERIK